MSGTVADRRRLKALRTVVASIAIAALVALGVAVILIAVALASCSSSGTCFSF